MPAGFPLSTGDDSQYPSPSLYDLVLLLNTEPGLDAWWQAVVSIMQDWFGAERLSLAVPADATDVENVPWGQKATYNVAGLERQRFTDPPAVSRPDPLGYNLSQAMQQTSTQLPSRATHLHSERRRPGLLARHSFAGVGAPRLEPSAENENAPSTPGRPRGLQRTVSYAQSALARSETPAKGSKPSTPAAIRLSEHTLNETPFSDPEFSSAGETSTHAVYAVLHALGHEFDPLIDNAGVNRLLERGKLVTLTRDYSSTTSSLEPESSLPPKGVEGQQKQSHSLPRNPAESPAIPGVRRQSGYEEYEQYPSSPWAQSPAPSPAIQADPSENPFFSTTNVDESSFNPTEISQDYSKLNHVEAIGVDNSSTVIHVPLLHPVFSQWMSTPEIEGDTAFSTTHHKSKRKGRATETLEEGRPLTPRKAPVAILSILSSTVPYPQNLAMSLKHLGPHLATTFCNANQYTTMQRQANYTQHRRVTSANKSGNPLEPHSLQGLMHLDIDNVAGSAAGSVTSPSDYSGRSKQSPPGSISGTPGWELSSRHGLTGTPGNVSGAEIVDSYFDAKKKASMSRSNSSAAVTQAQQHSKGGKISPTPQARTSSRRRMSNVSNEDEERARFRTEASKEKSNASWDDQSTPTPRAQDDGHLHQETQNPRKQSLRLTQTSHESSERRPHSLLHSYGADFSSSFQSLPSAATPHTAPERDVHHAYSSSSEQDMPPPSERLLRTIIDSLPVQIFTAAPTTGALTWVNSKFLVYTGQESRAVLRNPWQAIHPEDKPKYMESWNRCLRTGQQFAHKVRLQRFDEHYRWFFVRATPLKDKRQHIVHWVGTNMDIHEQHIAEVNSSRQQETAASEAKYRALANSSPQIVFAATKSKGVTFCNSQWVNYSGQSEAEALGVGFMDFVHPEDLSKCRLPTFDKTSSMPQNVPTSVPSDTVIPESPASTRNSSDASNASTVKSPGGWSPGSIEMPQAQLSQLASTGILKISRDADGRPSYSTEVRLRSKDDVYRWHLVRVLPAEPVLQDDTEETWYGTCTDINDHKLLEQTLKETMDAKSRFLSNMSHEIRTPLNGITGMVNFLIDSSLTAEQLEHVNIIRNSTEGLRDLINDILDLSKVEAGMITLTMNWLHVRSLIEEVNDLTSALAIDKGLELNYSVEPDVPSIVKGDRFRIRQVLLNVIGNAIKFTQWGEVFVRCKALPDQIGLSEHETLLQFEIVDTGSGFTEKEAEFLFKRFSQIDASSTRQHGGTGLGLAISMQLVELHGGKMKASSVPGQGSTFSFTVKFSLPYEKDLPPPELLPTPAPTPMASIDSATTEPREAALQLAKEMTESPSSFLSSPGKARGSPAPSSNSSNPSIMTGRTSLQSEPSSTSSHSHSHSPTAAPSIPAMHLELPERSDSTSRGSTESDVTQRGPSSLPGKTVSPVPGSLAPPLFSILVVCPLTYSRDATVKHIEMTLPSTVPHTITARESLAECQKMICGDDPVIFSHIVLSLQDVDQIIEFIDRIFQSSAHGATSVILISDLAQKREIIRRAPQYDDSKRGKDGRLSIIFKPLKPSKFAYIFDPQQEKGSKDRSLDSAQQVAFSQKQIFENMKRRLGNKGIRVLLVEDNKINQQVGECRY